MKPSLEKIPRQDGSSLAMLNRCLDEGIPFQWHHHPEYELTLTLNSRGQRFIGDHLGEYGDCDLVLVAPNLPHTWASREKVNEGPHVALVVWFHPDWIVKTTETFAEFATISTLLANAGRGLAFSPKVARDMQPAFETLFEQDPSTRLLSFLTILQKLETDNEAQTLASTAVVQNAESRERIDRVLVHIHSHYDTQIALTELAGVAALSVSGLHRMFRKHMQSSISGYVTALRIGDACARLSGGAQPIAHIAAMVGYGALANFNRQFKSSKGMTPRAYRALFQENQGKIPGRNIRPGKVY